MKRDARIYCRTTEKLRDELEKFAAEEKRSVSSVIEFILADYLRNRPELRDGQEKRQFRRKNVSIPALVKASGREGTGLESAMVLDLSLGGLNIALTKESAGDLGENGKATRFEAAFVLPNIRKPVRVLCKKERVSPLNDGCSIGASFVGTDFGYYHHLQKYLLS